MDIRPLSPAHAVSPQITPQDVAAIKEAGYVAIICNRPDAEVPPDLQADAVGAAAKAAGLAFAVLPATHDTIGPGLAEDQYALIAAADGPVLAYCASGTRCSILWALGQAGRMATADIIAAARSGGYDLAHLAPVLDQLAASRGKT